MKKLALETKLLSEYEQRIAELEKQYADDQATISSQASQIELLESEIEKRDRIINNFDTKTIVDCIDKYNTETKDMLKRVLEKISADGNNGLAEYFLKELNKKLTHILNRDQKALMKIGIIPSTNYKYPGNTESDTDDSDEDE